MRKSKLPYQQPKNIDDYIDSIRYALNQYPDIISKIEACLEDLEAEGLLLRSKCWITMKDFHLQASKERMKEGIKILPSFDWGQEVIPFGDIKTEEP